MALGEEMQRITYIRLVTYALIAFAAFYYFRSRSVIPAPLTVGPEVPFREADIKHIESLAIAREPGFEKTKKSGSEVLRLAIEHVHKKGLDLNLFFGPTFTLLSKSDKLRWLVTWEEKGVRKHTGPLGVVIDDDNGATEDLPGFNILTEPNQSSTVQRP